MRIGSLEKLFGAALVTALALPAVAQDNQPAARPAGGQTSQNDNASGVNRSGRTARTARPDAAPGATAEEAAPALDDNAQPGTRTANFPPQGDEGRAQGGRGGLNDQGLVRWIAAGNEAEIRVNEFAQQQAQNEQVKQFAQKMVDEHTKLGQQLQQAARQGNAADDTPAASDANSPNRPNRRNANAAAGGANEQPDNAPDQPATRRPRAGGAAAADDTATSDAAAGGRNAAAGGRSGNSPFLAFHEEIKRQCAESTIQALREKQGADFDHAFIHGQIVEHMGMIDTLTVAEQHASANLKQALQEARQHAEQHLQQAKQIADQLDKEGQRR